jgi:hypothetical protein
MDRIVTMRKARILAWCLTNSSRNIEALIAGATLLVIGIGTIGKFKERWMEARYKAENLRLLKFKKLADPRLWCQPIDQDSLAEDLNEDIREVGAQNYDAVKTWASQGTAPAICESPRAVGCEAALHELIEYYRQKRLHVQMNYLERSLPRTKTPDRGPRLSSNSFSSPVLRLFWLTSSIPRRGPCRCSCRAGTCG